MTIIYGIICLGLIVFVHELVHFIASRICCVTVESFSIGMGTILLNKTIKGTDYRLSLLPFGGYCGMKGESAFQDALDKKLPFIPKEEKSFYGVHPLKRAFIAFSGPAMNVIFAFIAFTIIALTGYTYYSADNRIILANEIIPNSYSAAQKAGLVTGDKIIAINDTPIRTFSEITEQIGTNPNENLKITVLRDNQQIDFFVPIILDKSSGTGKLGVMNWIDPIIANVEENSIAQKAGFLPGDKILSINEEPIKNTADIQKQLIDNTQLNFKILRNNDQNLKDISIIYNTKSNLGLQFSVPSHEASRYSLGPAIIQGIKETGNMISLTFKSLGLLFKGIDLKQAVSGPVRMTVMLGDTVKTGFSSSIRVGLVSTLNFLALISISLFIMNLLPIPVLDGGLILFAIIETIKRKPLNPKIMYYTQFIGIAFIIAIFGIALFSDINFLFSK